LKSMLLPLAALTGSAAFLFWQHAEQEPIRQQVTLFRETLQAVTSHREEAKARAEAEAAAHSGANGTSPSGAAKATRADIDLKELAKLMLGMRNGTMLDAEAMLKLQETIQELEPEELSGLIADAGKLDLPQDQRDGLVMMLITGLGEKDPKAGVMAAAEFRKSAPHSRFSFSDTMGSAFTAWAKKDLAGAMTWFDSAAAAGQFESKALDEVNREQTRMISRVLKQLWDHDPAAARQRLLALPDKERSAVLGSTEGFEKDAASQKQFSGLVRAILPEKKQINALNKLAATVYRKGNLESVTQLFATIEATPEERNSSRPEWRRRACSNRPGRMARKNPTSKTPPRCAPGWQRRMLPQPMPPWGKAWVSAVSAPPTLWRWSRSCTARSLRTRSSFPFWRSIPNRSLTRKPGRPSPVK